MAKWLKPTVHKLRDESIDDAVYVWGVSNHKLDEMLQGIRALGLGKQAGLSTLLTLKDGDLKDHRSTEL
jgi:hypothetical protein